VLLANVRQRHVFSRTIEAAPKFPLTNSLGKGKEPVQSLHP
jgi:hypothetical protein